MTKPTVQIKDAKILDHDCYGSCAPILYGTPIDYPDEHQYRQGALTNGFPIYTTKIVHQDGDIVETHRTIYKVLNWLEE